jgi:RHS repeat-associated protein
MVTTPAGGGASDTRYFLYDQHHRLIGEYGTTTADLRAEHIWLLPEVGGAAPFGGDDGLGGYMPLAVAVPAGGSTAIHWVQGNHLGTPVAVTDASGAVVTPSGYSMAGFPGQVRQQAELYYNYYRDYDVSLGRYVQADPIGLDGDTNPYLYAGGNPLSGIDPLGLQAGSIPLRAVCSFVPSLCILPAIIPKPAPAPNSCPVPSDRREVPIQEEGDAKRECHDKCVKLTVGRGYGSDAPGKYRACMRECLAGKGYKGY